MEYLTFLLPIIKFLIELFVKDKSQKDKMIAFIEERFKVSENTVELREDYERQQRELEDKAKNSNPPLH